MSERVGRGVVLRERYDFVGFMIKTWGSTLDTLNRLGYGVSYIGVGDVLKLFYLFRSMCILVMVMLGIDDGSVFRRRILLLMLACVRKFGILLRFVGGYDWDRRYVDSVIGDFVSWLNM